MDQYQILLKHSHTGDEAIIEIGLDEAGRGALAGPVTVAACIMPYGFQHELIKDSKLLSEPLRAAARQLVLDNCLALTCNGDQLSIVKEFIFLVT